jgi:hypothetical protein
MPAPAKPLPSLDRLHQLFQYDPSTGHLHWRMRLSNRTAIGAIAGKRGHLGYIIIHIDNVRYLAHRIAWALYYDAPTPPIIDHRDNDSSNNAIANLREASHAENMRNAKLSRRNNTGFKGVHYRAKRKKYTSHIRIDGKLKSLGYFDTAEAAHRAYCKAAEDAWGVFHNPG